MKILGILGSPRAGGNSDILLDEALKGGRESGAEIEKIVLSRLKIGGCLACGKCDDAGVCAIRDDMKGIREKILESDALIHSSPVYFWSMTSQMKAYLDRWCAFFDAQWRWHREFYPRMKGKRLGLITVCGDPDPSTADPIVHSFKTTAEFTKLRWIGAVMASASALGKIAGNDRALRDACELGRKTASGL